MVKKIRKRPGTRKAPARSVLLIVLVAILGGYWLYTGLYPDSLQFKYLVISRDGEPLKVINGETLRLHPSSKLRIKSISTNIVFDFGVRLVSTGIDINSLLYEEVALSELLPGKDIYNRYTIPVTVKRHTEEMGKIDLIIEPFVEDWVDKAKRTIESEKKISLLVKAVNLGYADREIINLLADEYVAKKEWKKAALILEKAVKESGSNSSIERLLEVYEALGNKSKIISTLKSLIEMNPEDNDLRVKLALALENAGKTSDAIKEYNKLLERVSEQDRATVYKALGYLYTKVKQYRNAINAYLKALKTDKNDVNIYYNISALYEAVGDGKSADNYLSKAIELKSDDVESRLKLSENLISRKQYSKAQKYLQEILQKKPNSLEAWTLIAKIEEKRGNKSALRTAYKKIISISPRSKAVVYNLGVLEYESGAYKAAADYFNKYLQLASGDVDAREFLFDIYIKQKNEKLAYSQALKILNARPNKKQYYHYIFDYLNRIKDYKSLANVMATGLRKRPNDNEIKEYLIIAYVNTGKENNALSLINDLLKVKPNDVKILILQASLYERLGQPNKALDIYKKVINLSPENEQAQESYLRLRLEVLN